LMLNLLRNNTSNQNFFKEGNKLPVQWNQRNTLLFSSLRIKGLHVSSITCSSSEVLHKWHLVYWVLKLVDI
jgi:hypothetical protein